MGNLKNLLEIAGSGIGILALTGITTLLIKTNGCGEFKYIDLNKKEIENAQAKRAQGASDRVGLIQITGTMTDEFGPMLNLLHHDDEPYSPKELDEIRYAIYGLNVIESPGRSYMVGAAPMSTSKEEPGKPPSDKEVHAFLRFRREVILPNLGRKVRLDVQPIIPTNYEKGGAPERKELTILRQYHLEVLGQEQP